MTEAALVLPAGTFEAYLFDLDGTVADSMPLHYRAWSTAVGEHGVTFPEDLFYAWGGIPLATAVERLNERFGSTLSAPDVIDRKERLYLSLIDEIQPIASVLAVIEGAPGHTPMAIVSGSSRASIQRTLSVLGLVDRFSVIVGAEDYTHGKPNPEPFLTAAMRLKIPPEKCLAFEDADAGIEAAEAAGMAWVRVPTVR